MENVMSIIGSFTERCKNRSSYLIFLWITIVILTLFFFQYEGIPKKLILLTGIMTSFGVLAVGQDLAKSTVFSILILGTIFSFISPVFDIPDEDRHMARVIHISEGNFGLSNNPEQIKISEDFERLLQNKGKTYRNNLAQFEHSNKKKTQDEMTATSTYSFISYIPQAFGWGIARVLNLNLFWSFYLGRMFNLISYAFMIYLALRIAKYWIVPIAVLSMFPMLVYLAASYNQDGFTMGLIFVIISLFLNFVTREKKITIIDISVYTILCSIMATSKLPYALLIGLLVFIKPEKFLNKKAYLSAYLSIIVLMIVMIGWFISFTGIKATHRSPEVNPVEQVKFMANHLNMTFKITMNSLVSSIEKFTMNFTFGWLTYSSSLLTYLYLFYLGGIVIFFPIKESSITKLNKLGITLVSLAIMTAIVLSQYVTWTPVGGKEIAGVQGRYFIGLFPMIPLLVNSSALFLFKSNREVLNSDNALEKEDKSTKGLEKEKISSIITAQNTWLITVNSMFIVGMILLTLSVYYKG